MCNVKRLAEALRYASPDFGVSITQRLLVKHPEAIHAPRYAGNYAVLEFRTR
jgi:hypothetical protein